MGEEFYSVIKLITGEEIFSLVSIDQNDGNPLLVLQNPVIMKMTRASNGITLRVKPWMEIPDDDFFIVSLSFIFTMTEVKGSSLLLFSVVCFLDVDDEPLLKDDKDEISNGKTEVTKGMGYISSVEDARKLLENLYKLKDNKDS